MNERPRRLRRSALIRELVQETSLSLNQLVQPYFLASDSTAKEPIAGFTGINRWGTDLLSRQMEKDLERGVKSFLLFGAGVHKNELGGEAYSEKGMVPQALRTLKARFGQNALLITDVCLCPYTSHGHCGLIDTQGEISNDSSLEPLAKMSLVHAAAGADFVAPSDMMDGRVGFIRRHLDEKGHPNVGILAYTAKYASSYYGPFREALASSPQGGSDRSSYQMDFHNRRDALRELKLDLAEGADIVMVKPALAYLDVISAFAVESTVPVAAYSVSGEYEMVKRLAAAGMADERRMATENLVAIRRAGAQVIITYYASEMAEKGWLK